MLRSCQQTYPTSTTADATSSGITPATSGNQWGKLDRSAFTVHLEIAPVDESDLSSHCSSSFLLSKSSLGTIRLRYLFDLLALPVSLQVHGAGAGDPLPPLAPPSPPPSSKQPAGCPNRLTAEPDAVYFADWLLRGHRFFRNFNWTFRKNPLKYIDPRGCQEFQESHAYGSTRQQKQEWPLRWAVPARFNALGTLGTLRDEIVPAVHPKVLLLVPSRIGPVDLSELLNLTAVISWTFSFVTNIGLKLVRCRSGVNPGDSSTNVTNRCAQSWTQPRWLVQTPYILVDRNLREPVRLLDAQPEDFRVIHACGTTRNKLVGIGKEDSWEGQRALYYSIRHGVPGMFVGLARKQAFCILFIDIFLFMVLQIWPYLGISIVTYLAGGHQKIPIQTDCFLFVFLDKLPPSPIKTVNFFLAINGFNRNGHALLLAGLSSFNSSVSGSVLTVEKSNRSWNLASMRRTLFRRYFLPDHPKLTAEKRRLRSHSGSDNSRNREETGAIGRNREKCRATEINCQKQNFRANGSKVEETGETWSNKSYSLAHCLAPRPG
ncbi:metalloprotease m41 ftsh [Culex quinquefasciatus]|uniref:Metalloprotease m41 ftsh n=1 Tax=Culex quinquefasciatus TaxID=7176 RepID=B0XL20_CULQU|nr:metalloprotease m41 ftsh [Culex quinquefasciatus]|eukprot:XP_001870342.1 metalloprotease m41 ftsh [Culex quinquefasciatus]